MALTNDVMDAVATLTMPSRARADFHAICFARHHQLSVGAVLQLPQMDKFGNPVRHDCRRLHGGEPCEAAGQIVFTEKVVMPDIRGLQFEIERYDPRLEPSSEPPPSAGPDLNSAEAIAEGAKLMDLYYAGVQVLVDLGVPLPQIEGAQDIETTATHPGTAAPAEPANVTDKPKPAPAKIKDAF